MKKARTMSTLQSRISKPSLRPGRRPSSRRPSFESGSQDDRRYHAISYSPPSSPRSFSFRSAASGVAGVGAGVGGAGAGSNSSSAFCGSPVKCNRRSERRWFLHQRIDRRRSVAVRDETQHGSRRNRFELPGERLVVFLLSPACSPSFFSPFSRDPPRCRARGADLPSVVPSRFQLFLFRLTAQRER